MKKNEYEYSLLLPARLKNGVLVAPQVENPKDGDLHVYSTSRRSFGTPNAERAVQYTVKGQIVSRFHLFQSNGKANLQLCQFPNGSLQYVNQANIKGTFVGTSNSIIIGKGSRHAK
jgi:hypothetical protein